MGIFVKRTIMRYKNKITAIFAATMMLGAFAVSCEEDEIYVVNSPSWIDAKVDSIAEAKKNQVESDGPLSAEEAYQVGITGDFTNKWWGSFSKYYRVAADDTLTLKFRNYSDCLANYHNWAGYITSDANIADTDNGYVEYIGQRADRWDNVLGESAVFTGTMVDGLADDEAWKAWLKTMDNAEVTFTVIRKGGKIYTYSTTITSDGKSWTCNQESGLACADEYVRVFIPCEESYLQFFYSNKVGELDPKSTVREVDLGNDYNPVSITVAGYPTSLEIGDTNFWKSTVATVTFEDGSSAEADSADITFTVVPDITTVGEKNVVLSYSKTKKGNYAQAVGTSYKIDVTAPITAIEVVQSATAYYYVPGTTSVTEADINPASFISQVLGKTGSADIIIPAASYTTSVAIPETFGEDIVITVKYETFETTFNIAVKQMESAFVSLAGEVVGAEDFSSAFNSVHSSATKIEAGTGSIFTFNHKNAGTDNYKTFLIALTKDGKPCAFDDNCYGLMRGDNYAWGHGVTGANWAGDCDLFSVWTVESTWVWDGDETHATMREAISDAKVSVEVINKGATVDVKCTIVSNVDNQEYTQNYLNIPVNGDVYVSFSCELANLTFE